MKKTYPLFLLLVVLFALGLGIRLYDMGDPPLDFHPTRQLRNAIVARGIYYDLQANADPTIRSQAASLHDTIGIYEPPIIETITALGYRLTGGENLAIPRIINSLLWLGGGLVLFLLARAMTSTAGAVFALGYYLFLPFGIQASRSFQPDPVMTVGIILTLYCFYHWSQTQTWKWAILAGIFGGLAVLIKLPAVYLVAAAALASVLSV
jgi:4-amino-4-deoxy-L-arabinose transferase-like glycosyltransferase